MSPAARTTLCEHSLHSSRPCGGRPFEKWGPSRDCRCRLEAGAGGRAGLQTRVWGRRPGQEKPEEEPQAVMTTG